MSSPASATTYGKYVDLQNYLGAAPSTSGSLYLSGSDASEILYTNIGMDVAGGVTAEGLLSGSSLAILGGTAMTAVLDEDAMGSDSATALATQQSIKAYVDSQVGANNDLTIQGDSGGALVVTLDEDDLNILGTANEISVAGSKAGTEVTMSIGLPDDVTIGGNLTVTTDVTATGGTAAFAAVTATTMSGTVGSLTSLKVNGTIGPSEDTDLLTLESGQLDVAGVVSGSGNAEFGGNLTIGPSQYGLTSAGALKIASMSANWTNASRTVADMGIVTTMDLNGGSIDGTEIGAASAAAGTFAAIVGTSLSVSDGSITNVNDIALDTISADDGSSFTISDDWTNASNTVADLGTVTTMDLNGGSIDGTTIGAASVAAGSFAAIVGTTATLSSTLTANGNVTLGNAASDVITLTGQVTASANFLFKSSTSELPVVTIQNDNADDEGGVLRFMKESDSPADSDYCGMIEFKAHDSADNVTEYANIAGQSLDVTDGSEDGAVIIECVVAGTLREVAQFWDGTNGLVLPNNSTYGTAKAHSFITYSDETLKKNIQPIANPMDKLMLLQGVTYDWKEDGTNDIGFIAQDVEKVIPEVVYSAEGKEGSYGLDYASLTALLTEAIKQQQTEIDALKRRLDK